MNQSIFLKATLTNIVDLKPYFQYKIQSEKT